jgi:5-carboxymethyl-2-hydroxymuconic-semialdehyde dehydrogenase
MSELSPLTAARLGELAMEAGIPPGVLNVVHGYGTEAGAPLCQHRDVRVVSFTGSTATGDRIIRAAGMKKFSMELGGKSPFVIFDDADMARALDAAIFMIFSNNGERCTAGSRIFVQQSSYADFVQRFVERAAMQRAVLGCEVRPVPTAGPGPAPSPLAAIESERLSPVLEQLREMALAQAAAGPPTAPVVAPRRRLLRRQSAD